MNFVTYNNIRLKCYINVSKCLLDILYIAPHKVAGSPILARAIDNFNPFFKQLKKFYLFLATYSVMSSITISLIVLCFLAAITFSSVFNSSSIVMCNFVSLIFITSFVSCVLYLCYYVFILLCY